YTSLFRSRAPPSGVTVNFTVRRSGGRPQVSRRGTCKCVRAGSGLLWRWGRGPTTGFRGGRAAGGGSSSDGPDGRCGGRGFDRSESLESIEAGGDRGNLVGGPVPCADGLDVLVEQALVGPLRPLGETGHVVALEARSLPIDLEGGVGVPACQPVPDEAIDRVHEPAVLACAGAEPQRLAELFVRDG